MLFAKPLPGGCGPLRFSGRSRRSRSARAHSADRLLKSHRLQKSGAGPGADGLGGRSGPAGRLGRARRKVFRMLLRLYCPPLWVSARMTRPPSSWMRLLSAKRNYAANMSRTACFPFTGGQGPVRPSTTAVS